MIFNLKEKKNKKIKIKIKKFYVPFINKRFKKFMKMPTIFRLIKSRFSINIFCSQFSSLKNKNKNKINNLKINK
jgi:hypothetical protein